MVLKEQIRNTIDISIKVNILEQNKILFDMILYLIKIDKKYI